MGAETRIWVEVIETHKRWVESYGVTGDEAVENVHIANPSLRLDACATGEYSFEDPSKEEAKNA